MITLFLAVITKSSVAWLAQLQGPKKIRGHRAFNPGTRIDAGVRLFGCRIMCVLHLRGGDAFAVYPGDMRIIGD